VSGTVIAVCCVVDEGMCVSGTVIACVVLLVRVCVCLVPSLLVLCC